MASEKHIVKKRSKSETARKEEPSKSAKKLARSEETSKLTRSSSCSSISKRNTKNSKSEKSGRKQKKNPVDGFRLIHSSGEIVVKEADLVAVSELMKMRHSEGRLGKAIDLRQFGQECVFLLAEYITKRTVKAQISFFTVAEILKLGKAFMMNELNRKMEEVLVDVALQSGANLIQALLVNDVSPVSRETELQLHYLGAWAFLDLVRLPDFHKIPPNQFMQIFASCELNVSHEMVAVDAALYWLATQPKIDILAPAVFALVRSAYLGPTERGLIVERTAVLNFPESVTRIIRTMLDSRHNSRICLRPEHIARHIPRCGVASLSFQPTEATLPISRPREELLRSRLAKKTTSEKSSKSGRNKWIGKKKPSDKSLKSTKSSKANRKTTSERSNKSGRRGKSSKSEKSERSSKAAKKARKNTVRTS